MVFGVGGSNGAVCGSINSKMAADGHHGTAAILEWRRVSWTFLSFSVVTCAEEGGYVFTLVCLFVCPSDNWKSCERILTKFLGGVRHGPGTKGINFGDDPDHCPDPGIRSQKSRFTGLKKYLVDSDQSCIANLHCKNHSAILLCWRLAEVCAVWVLIVSNFSSSGQTKTSRPWCHHGKSSSVIPPVFLTFNITEAFTHTRSLLQLTSVNCVLTLLFCIYKDHCTFHAVK